VIEVGKMTLLFSLATCRLLWSLKIRKLLILKWMEDIGKLVNSPLAYVFPSGRSTLAFTEERFGLCSLNQLLLNKCLGHWHGLKHAPFSIYFPDMLLRNLVTIIIIQKYFWLEVYLIQKYLWLEIYLIQRYFWLVSMCIYHVVCHLCVRAAWYILCTLIIF
jgi:hypothetical protein